MPPVQSVSPFAVLPQIYFSVRGNQLRTECVACGPGFNSFRSYRRTVGSRFLAKLSHEKPVIIEMHALAGLAGALVEFTMIAVNDVSATGHRHIAGVLHRGIDNISPKPVQHAAVGARGSSP